MLNISKRFIIRFNNSAQTSKKAFKKSLLLPNNPDKSSKHVSEKSTKEQQLTTISFYNGCVNLDAIKTKF